MEIISIKYLIFVLIFLLVFQLITPNLRQYWTFSFSLFFYGSISYILLVTLLISIIFNYWITFTQYKLKKWYAIIFNLLLLFSFKLNPSTYLVPIGVSFFTFQALSFVFDNKEKDQVPLINFANYLAFFPQLIAGPIESYSNLGKQLAHLKSIKKHNLFPGVALILKGLVIKFVIANRCGIIVDSFFDNISKFDGWMLILSNLLFTMQILLDFSGYCLIAGGFAKLLGINLSKNFFQPYLSTSLSEFWKRWHTTLHIWFKKYVFKSIINRLGFWKSAGIVFFLSSLWHGVKLNFIIWGLICVLFLLLDKFFIQNNFKSKKIKWITTLSMIFISWIPFRISNPSDFIELFHLKWGTNHIYSMLSDHSYVLRTDFINNLSSTCEYAGVNLGITYLDFYVLAISLFTFCSYSVLLKNKKTNSFYSSILLFVIFCFLGFDNSTPFIYFQF